MSGFHINILAHELPPHKFTSECGVEADGLFLGCFLSDETDYYRVDNVILFWSQTDFALFQNI